MARIKTKKPESVTYEVSKKAYKLYDKLPPFINRLAFLRELLGDTPIIKIRIQKRIGSGLKNPKTRTYQVDKILIRVMPDILTKLKETKKAMK